jgi:hypothetical protein
VDVPLRLRFRFASDQSNTAMGWSVAGLQSEILAASAQLSVGRDPGGDLVARATLRGSTAGLVTLLFRYRVPGEQEWKPASSLFPAPSNSEFVVQSLNLPRSVRVAAIALFAEVPEGGGGSTPPLLLGTTGYRAASEIAMPTLLRNPTGRPVIFQLSPLPTDLTMEVFDVRGRRVGAVTIPAGQSWHEWSGVDRHGTRLASGVYFLSVKGHRNLHRRILLLN